MYSLNRSIFTRAERLGYLLSVSPLMPVGSELRGMDPDGGFSHQHLLVCRVLPLARDDGWAFGTPWLAPLPSSPGEGKASGCEAVYLGMCCAL